VGQKLWFPAVHFALGLRADSISASSRLSALPVPNSSCDRIPAPLGKRRRVRALYEKVSNWGQTVKRQQFEVLGKGALHARLAPVHYRGNRGGVARRPAKFGASRMMWGSNFPATNDRSLKEQYDLARNELSFVPEADQRRLFGETALSLWPMLQ
jgi:amidohydrolase family protein